ncbi:MAG: hypothetical protein KO253_04545 [Methanobrevibacter arboriphilus]|nr:hypothetical protein [Methanobrevibacter arboriphilus]
MDNFKEIIPLKKWSMPIKFSQLNEIELYAENIDVIIMQGKYIGKIKIKTIEKYMIAEDTDWVVCDIKNNLYVIKSLFIKE